MSDIREVIARLDGTPETAWVRSAAIFDLWGLTPFNIKGANVNFTHLGKTHNLRVVEAEPEPNGFTRIEFA